MAENTDQLEETLMLAAAAADRRYEGNHSYSTKNFVDSTEGETSEDDTVPNTQTKNEDSYNKRKGPQEDEDPRPLKKLLIEPEKPVSHSEMVATHYNLIEDKGLKERAESKIIYLRRFHNWIKSMLINEYLTKIKDSKKQFNPPIRVFDLCGGKGGDLEKWRKGNVTHVIVSDIAEGSLEDCKQRYNLMKQSSQNRRRWNSGNLFSIEYIHGDAGKVRYREKFEDPSLKLDLVSSQFAFHYSFESLPQAECWLKNASECLQAGGYFIGTMVDSNEVISRARKSNNGRFGNDIYQVIPHFDIENPPLFGGKYDFKLDGRVNCPEFLVHFLTFVKLAKKYGLRLVKKEKFGQFFERIKVEGRRLLVNMAALESYPARDNKPLTGDAPDDYNHATTFISRQGNSQYPCGTLSKSDWEVSSLYLTFAFEKEKVRSWNKDGTPCYD
ncbi:mRNA cap guanine-N7 methyltransferase isoform X1 [Euwallacea fornicatus]|uniref:mRNA cap guanine-N7 methyltransferase isoform X1 n=1 Tax=Euwallacea fornicatus TaxID=995702 RepID=UPI00338D9090